MNIDLYEALRAPVGEEAARTIAEVVPAADDVATKAEVYAVQADLRAVEARLDAKIDGLKVEMHREFSAVKGWLIGMMIPLWLGVYGTMITLIVQN